MTTSVFHRRRAERFAQLLDEASGARRSHSRSRADADLAELVTLGNRVAQLPLTVEADPEFRTGLRAMLMATIEREGMGATAVDPEQTADVPAARHRRSSMAARLGIEPGLLAPLKGRRARGAIVVGLTAGTLAISGMSAASGDAAPGDALYGVKRSTEKAQLALAGSDVSRGQLYLEFARTRASEALLKRGDVAALSTVLGDMDNETRQGAKLLHQAAIERRDPAALDVVDAFVAEQQKALRTMAAGANGPAQQRAGASLALLDQIRKRSTALRPVLNCGATSSDVIGPVPRSCGAQPVAPQQQPQQQPAAPAAEQQPAVTGPSTEATPRQGSRAGTPSGAPAAGTPAGTSTSPSPKSRTDRPAQQDDNLIEDVGKIIGGLVG